MWIYEKRLLYPINIKKCNPRMATLIAMLYGGPNGELSAGVTYLNQRYSMPDDTCKAILTDIGTEECVPVRLSMLRFLLLGSRLPFAHEHQP